MIEGATGRWELAFLPVIVREAAGFLGGLPRSRVSLILLSTKRAIRNGTVAVPWDA